MTGSEKKELIIKSAQELMKTNNIQSISVSSIAKQANISKGSIYYYFESKEEIIDAVFEHSYSNLIEGGKKLIENSKLDVFSKMKIMYEACLEAAKALHIQTENCASFTEKQYVAHYHQQFTNNVITNTLPVLTEIIKQGVAEGVMECDNPQAMAEIILTMLTIIIDNQIIPCSIDQIIERLKTFASMQEKSMNLPKGSLSFLYADENN